MEFFRNIFPKLFRLIRSLPSQSPDKSGVIGELCGIIRHLGSGIIADNLRKSGWSWGSVSAIDREGRTIWIADAHCEGKRFVVHADEKLTAFVELESATRAVSL